MMTSSLSGPESREAPPPSRFGSSAARAAAKKKKKKKKKKSAANAEVGGAEPGACFHTNANVCSCCGGAVGGAVAAAAAAAAAARAFKGDLVRTAGGTDVRQCAHCGVLESEDTPLQQCARCKMVAYCSIEHQKKHWKHGGHKGECGAQRPLAILEEVKTLFKAGRSTTQICEKLVGMSTILPRAHHYTSARTTPTGGALPRASTHACVRTIIACTLTCCR